MEVQVKNTQAQLQAMLDSLLDGILLCDANGIIVSANAGAAKMFAYKVEELMGQVVSMLIGAPERNNDQGLFAWLEQRDTAHGMGHDIHGVSQTGQILSLELTISELMLQGEQMFVLQLRDITERKQGEKLRERLAAMVDSSDDAIISKTLEGTITAWNRGAENVFGYTASEMVGKPIFLLLAPEQVEEELSIQTRIGRGETVEPFETVRVRKDGKKVDVSVTISPIRDGKGVLSKDGVLHGGVIAFRDITRRKADELEIRKLQDNLEEKIVERTAQLQDANRELEAFSYSVSHDLRTPLRHIAGFARILGNDFGSALHGEAREHLQRIEDAVRRMGLLIDALLAMAVLRRHALKLRHTELNPLVAEVISVLEPECAGRAVEWRIGQLPALDCDPVLMRQVLQNLLSNALKYSSGRNPAVIEVDSIQQADKPAVILVRDNGAGFDMKYSRKLFGMFQRLHTESEFAGTGVGLATVHRIIQKHGGTIWAEAEPGHGATFYFALQVTEQPEVAENATAFPLTWPNGPA